MYATNEVRWHQILKWNFDRSTLRMGAVRARIMGAVRARIMSDCLYSGRYYSDRHALTSAAAQAILDIVQSILPGPIRSAADVGCGVGTWLATLNERGCADIVGYDGDWVPTEHLRIPADRLIRCDVSKPIPINRRFDLALSLECAEHLPPEAAVLLVESLCRLSDFVLFSAAVPNQTGEGHINEQWPEYWARLFFKREYVCLDWLRPQLWNDESIPWWYRQNAILFVRSKRMLEVRPLRHSADISPLPLVHPRLLKMWAESQPVQSSMQDLSVRGALRQLVQAIARKMGDA
jgi:SAM-dependent methyltransferase